MSLILTIRASCASLAERARGPRVAGLLRAGGWAVLLAALAYLARALGRFDWALLGDALTGPAWALTLLCAVAYAVLLMLLAAAWAILADPAKVLHGRALAVIYGFGVVAKYLPGSLFQYAARQVRGSQLGLAQRAMAQSSMAEAALHIPAALLAGGVLWAGGGYVALLALAAVAACGWRVAKAPLLRVAGCQIAFFALLALLALLLARYGLLAEHPDRLAAAFMLAWVAGFLVPVAPGGIGVREAALLALVAGAEGAAMVGNFALLMRVVTTAGDGLLGLAAYGLALRTRENRQASA